MNDRVTSGPTSPAIAPRLDQAWQRRAPLHATSELDTYRVVDGGSDDAPGLVIERFADTAAVRASPDWRRRRSDIDQFLLGRVDRVVWPGAEPTPGPAPTAVVCEPGLRFVVEPGSPNPGLYLDARDARAWLLASSHDRRVADLFSFAGALGTAAAVGGGRVVFVDRQKRALRRARSNVVENGLRADDRDFVRDDVYRFLRRNQRPFDGIILASAPRVPGRPDQDYAALAPLAVRALAPGGWLLCFFHPSGQPKSARERDIMAAVEVPVAAAWRGTSGCDFPAAPERKLHVTAFVRT